MCGGSASDGIAKRLRVSQESAPEHLKRFARYRPEFYDLYLDDQHQAVLIKAVDLELIRRGTRPRLVAANLHRETLQRLSLEDLSSLTHYRDCWDDWLLRDALQKLELFLEQRDSPTRPYHAALSHTAELKKLELRTVSLDAARSGLKAYTWIEVGSEKENYPVSCIELKSPDLALIGTWQAGRDSWTQPSKNGSFLKPFSLVSLSCARLAEKLVVNYYRRVLGIEAHDVSATQISGTSELWKMCDVQADILIDVKNASHHRTNVRHAFVSKFKRVNGEDVAIAGVDSHLSYSARGHTFNPASGIRAWVNQTFMGVVFLPTITKVQDAINGLPDRLQKVQVAFYPNALPPWAFELPGAGIDHDHLFTLASVFAWKPETILCTAVASGRLRDAEPYRRLNGSQKRIVNLFADVVERGGYSKATIALFAISEFVNRCLAQEDPSAFIRYFRKILSIEDFTNRAQKANANLVPYFRRQKLKYEVSIDCEESCCGGLQDPTDSIRKLLELLEKCGDAIKARGITFTHFDAPHPYILLGKTTEGLALTLYAYCGGKLSSGAWCNRFPLVVGEHAICDGCGKLICDECDFCSEGCAKSRP